jgi:hypothetical protein
VKEVVVVGRSVLSTLNGWIGRQNHTGNFPG